MRPLAVFGVIVPILFFAACAGAETRIDLKTVYYNVKADSLDELRRELDANTPIHHGTETFHANTSWYVKWNMRWSVKDRSCEVIDLTARVNITITLPKWVNYGDAGSRDRDEWDRYYKMLVDHEDGHRALAVEAGKKVEREILSMGPKDNCVILKREANRLGQKIVKEYNSRSEQYDRQTDHGRKQQPEGL